MQLHTCWVAKCTNAVSSSLRAAKLYSTSSCHLRATSRPAAALHHGQSLYCRKALRVSVRGVAVQAGRGALKELQQLQRVETDTGLVVNNLEWQSPLEIILYPDPRLRAKNARIGTFDDNLKRFSRELLDVMYKASDGVGLAAPQVGVNIRLMVFNPTGIQGDEEFVLVNPKLIHSNKRKDVEEEGCLSFPKIYADVERPTQIKVRAQDLTGKRMEVAFEGWQARIFQHEFDHLQGVLFHDRMNSKELSKVKGQLQDLEGRFEREQPGVDIRKVQ